MQLVQIITFLFWTLVIPVCLGAGASAFVEKQQRNIAFMWITGFLLYLALFQIVSVPIILLQGRLDFEERGAFSTLVLIFGCLSTILAMSGLIVWRVKRKEKPKLHIVTKPEGKSEYILWCLVGALLLLQLVMAVLLEFGDGDDAYYVAVSTVTESSDTMYLILPYTGRTTGLDIRHSLAPFPVLIAFWARVSGLHTATVAHIAMPLLMIPLTYCIYGMIGNRLFKGKKRSMAVFLIFTEILVMWGNYSAYTAETFLMIRSWQGKAVLANVIIPSAFLLLYMIGERFAEKREAEGSLWFLLFMLVESASLCSTQGCVLLATLLGCFGFCLLFVYKKWKPFLMIILCLVPAAVYMSLYLWLR